MNISATWLDAYRLFSDVDVPWMTEEKLIAQIRGSEPMSLQAQTGINAHRLLQEPGRFLPAIDGSFHVGEDRFSSADFVPVIRRQCLERSVSEVRFEKEMTVEGLHVTLVGKADSARGRVLGEFKFKIEKPVTAEDYFASRQPFLYLWMGGFDRIDYQCYSLKDQGGVWHIGQEVLFSLFPYRHMEQDCLHWIREYLGWAKGKDLSRVA